MPTGPSPFTIRNIQLFIAFRILFNCRFYYPVFTILFLDYGLTIEQFSLLNTAWAISIFCAEVPSGALADIVGRRLLLIAAALFMVVEMAIIAFVPLADISLVFWAFLLNRVLSGLAEAMASGADEAIAYDSLAAQGLKDQWPKVLSLQMRLRSVAGVLTAIFGALLYDPAMINRLLGWLSITSTVNQQQTMRYPVYLTLAMALFTTVTALMFRESIRERRQRHDSRGFGKNLTAALKLTAQAGSWILRTPFALTVIIFGLFYDHIQRMVITMSSQYFRLIHLPEASFGLISAALSLLGIVVPKLCEKMVDRNSPQKNMFILLAITVGGLLAMAGFYPCFGLLPVALVYTGINMVGFFTSHYLNRLTSSDQRATVLSFKGMAFNLGYGLIGLLFALLMQQTRAHTAALHPGWSAEMVEQTSFIHAMGWFPWYTLVLFCVALWYCRRKLASTSEHRERGKEPSR